VGGWEQGSVEVFNPEAKEWLPLIPMPDRRSFHASVVLLNTLYVAGGQDEKKKELNTLLRYYPHPTKPKWIQCAPMNSPRFVFGLGVLNRKIIAVGGLTDQGEYSVVEEKPNSTAEAYDPGSNIWTTDFPKLPVPARGVAMATLGDFVYVVAGELACRMEKGNDTPAGTWELIAPPSMRTSHSAMTSLGDHIYAMGGIKRIAGKQVSVDCLERYDPATNTWAAMAPLQNARHSMAVGTLNGKIYACGGTMDDQTATAIVEVYDPETNMWEYGPSMLRARGGASASVLDMVLPGSSESVAGSDGAAASP